MLYTYVLNNVSALLAEGHILDRSMYLQLAGVTPGQTDVARWPGVVSPLMDSNGP